MSIIDCKVVNLDALKLEHFAHGDTFESRGSGIGPLHAGFGDGFEHTMRADPRVDDRARAR